jgi:hypothetical protein
VYNPAQVMQQVIVNGWGGGVRPGDINPATNSYIAGSLTSSLVSTVTVGPYSSVILLNQGVPVQMPPGAGGGGAATAAPFVSRMLADFIPSPTVAVSSDQISDSAGSRIILPESEPAADPLARAAAPEVRGAHTVEATPSSHFETISEPVLTPVEGVI